jgi:hypothetical protein
VVRYGYGSDRTFEPTPSGRHTPVVAMTGSLDFGGNYARKQPSHGRLLRRLRSPLTEWRTAVFRSIDRLIEVDRRSLFVVLPCKPVETPAIGLDLPEFIASTHWTNVARMRAVVTILRRHFTG